MQPDDFILLMKMRGWVLFERVVEASFVERLAQDLHSAYEQCRRVQVHNGLQQDTSGTAHHILGRGDSLDEFLRRRPGLEHVRSWLGGKCILNSYGGFINHPGDQAYVNRVHRDIRSYVPESPLMVNMLVMLDDFTQENGATYMLSGSHHLPERPPDPFFFQHAERLLGPRGSIAVWDSNLWHAAGRNTTQTPRRALTLTFTRPFFKQQLDYPRLLGADYLNGLDEETRQLLGVNARVPATLEEWYQPPEKRFYKSDQG